MAKNTAIVVEKPGLATASEVSIPKLRPDYILIKVNSVALNPTDWKHIDKLADKGSRIGCDYAGVVEEVGNEVTKDLKKGDRVAGFIHGGNVVNHDDGAFGNYVTARGDIQIKIPDNLSFEEASTLGVGITTVGQALYQSLKLPFPDKPTSEKATLLIYGGSTATGSLAIQFARLSGLTVVTICSPKNFDYVKSLGAVAAFDYNSSTCSEDIKKEFPDIKYAFDCITEKGSPEITVAAMSAAGGVYTSLLKLNDEQTSSVNKINDKVKTQMSIAYTVVGEAFEFGPAKIPAVPSDFEFGKAWWELSRKLLGEGKIKVHKPAVNKFGSGFNGILGGLQALRESKVSGEKLVFTL